MDPSGAEVTLIVLGVPALLTIAVLLLVYVPDSLRASRTRYRPGRAWPFEPMWLESSQRPETDGPGEAASLAEAGERRALPSGSAFEVQRASAEAAPVPGPGLTRARARRTVRNRTGEPKLTPELPGGARGTW